MTSLVLGGGRETKESEIDLSVGIKIHKKVGDYVGKDEPIAVIHANDADKLAAVKKELIAAYKFSDEPVKVSPLIKNIIR